MDPDCAKLFLATAAGLFVASCNVGDNGSAERAAVGARATGTSLGKASMPAIRAAAAIAAQDHSQSGCTPIRFQRGTSSATISGMVSADGPHDNAPQPACYTIAVGEAQHAEVRLLPGSSDNVGITIPGVGDMRHSFEFTTRRGTYTLELHQLFPNTQPAPFRLYVAVSGRPSSSQRGTGTAEVAAAAARRLVGNWGLDRDCRDDFGITYKRDGSYDSFTDHGLWSLEENRLSVTPTGIHESGDPDGIVLNEPIVSRIAWRGADEFLQAYPSGSRLVFYRCS